MPDTRLPPPAPLAPARWRTLFLSDLHLGALGCRADLLLGFLASNRAETYVLAGDVLDLWQPLLPHWTEADQAVVDHLEARRAEGARMIYLRGNHDPDPSAAPEGRRLTVEAVEELEFAAADGRCYLVLHGDAIDSRLFRQHAMTRLGSRIDHALRRTDRMLARLRRQSRGEARTAIEAAMAQVNAALYAGRSHERRLVAMARARGMDGVICGHFHIAGLHDDHGLIYANCGDWVDSFTALAEGDDGRLCLLGGRAEAAQLAEAAVSAGVGA
jgi:UDP-2,3-diacylglucosamine pyrophosphatase LpxH